MSESSFQQFAALARNLHQFKDAGLRIISLGGSASPDGRIRIYVQIPASTALKHGTARLIPISSTALAEAATTSKKAAANAAPAAGPTSSSTTKAASSVVAATTTAKAAADTAKALKDPIGQIVKEVQDKLPALEAAAKAEDLGAKAAKNLVERAKVGVDLLKTTATATAPAAAVSETKAVLADAVTTLAKQEALALQKATSKQTQTQRSAAFKAAVAVTALSVAAGAAAAAYLYKEGKLTRETLEEYRDKLVEYLPFEIGKRSKPSSGSEDLPPSERPALSPGTELTEDDALFSSDESGLSLSSSVAESDIDNCDAGLKKLMLKDGDSTPGALLSPTLPPSEVDGPVADLSMSAISDGSATPSDKLAAEEWVVVKESDGEAQAEAEKAEVEQAEPKEVPVKAEAEAVLA